MSLGSSWKIALGSLMLSLALLSGCNEGFYLSESEVTAFHENFREESRANNLLASLEGKVIRLNFRTINGRPEIASSNLLETLRAIPNLFVLEQLFRQIDLERLAGQLEESLEGWIADSVGILKKGADSRIELSPLREASVRIISAPTVMYDRRRQAFRFTTLVRLRIAATLHVRRLDGVLRAALGWLIPPDADYPITLIIDNFRIAGDFRPGPGPKMAARVYARFFPYPNTVTVQGNLPSSIRNKIRELSRQKFASPVRESYPLIFDYFALSNLHLNDNTELQLSYRSRPEYSQPVVHVVAAGEDWKLYHTYRKGDRWTPYREIPFSADHGFPVALTSSGPGHLELLTVARNGELSYAGWRDGRWQDIHTSSIGNPTGPFDGFKPAMVATAPGQIEAVLRGTDGRLYHLRRLNGRWMEPVPVPIHQSTLWEFPLFHPVAVQSGNKIVLVFVDNTSRPYVMIYDLETGFWGHPVPLIGPGVFYPPALASCGDGLVELVYVAPDHTVFHRRLTIPSGNITARTGQGVGTGQLTDVGGYLTAGPAIACSGNGQLQLVGRGRDNKMWHNQYRSPQTSTSGLIDGRRVRSGWQDWRGLDRQFFGSRFSVGVDGLPAGIASSGSGKVAVLSRQRVSSGNLVYNEFDSSRYAKARWKSVHWRGFSRLENRRFRGSRAIAIADRQLHIVSRGQTGELIHSGLADNHLAQFRIIPNSAHPLRRDPTVLASGPGMVDILFPGIDGRINHLRWINQSLMRRHLLPRFGLALVDSSVAAVSFGAGQIEVVALANTNTLYHWRYLNGQWTAPVAIASNIVSVPALVNVGAGKMELLAVGGDQKVHRWRFAKSQWHDFGTIRTDFPVSAVKFGASAASSWGDGTVDVVMVEELTGVVYHYRLLGADAPRSFIRWFNPFGRRVARIGGRVADVPVLTAVGPNRLNLLVSGADGRIYSSWTRVDRPERAWPASSFSRARVTPRPGTFRWSAFRPIDAKQPILIGQVADLGDGELVVAASHPNGRIYLSRFLGHRWTVFLPLAGLTQENYQSPPLSRPALIIR